MYDSYFDSHLERSRQVSPKSLERSRMIYQKLLRKFLPPHREAKILDIGCGYGNFIYFLKKAGYESVIGIDISKQQVEQAARLGIRDVKLDDFASFLEERVSEFDVITALDVMEHLKKEEVLKFMSVIFRALKPGGKFLVQVPNGTSPFSGRYRYGDFTHELSYTNTSIHQIFTVCGFKRINCFPVEPAVHGVASAARYCLWQGIELLLRFMLLVETGEFRDVILTQNLIAVAEKAEESPDTWK